MARTVVSNVQVLTAGTRYDQEEAKDGKPQRSTVVTLAVLPDDGERIALAPAKARSRWRCATRSTSTRRRPTDQARGADAGHRPRAGARSRRSGAWCRPKRSAAAAAAAAGRAVDLQGRSDSRRQANEEVVQLT